MNDSKLIPKGLSAAADVTTVGLQTMVLWNSSGSTFGSLGNAATGDFVVGQMIGPSADVAEPTAKVLADLPTLSSVAANAQSRRTERRALEMLRREKAKLGRHRDKHRDHR